MEIITICKIGKLCSAWSVLYLKTENLCTIWYCVQCIFLYLVPVRMLKYFKNINKYIISKNIHIVLIYENIYNYMISLNPHNNLVKKVLFLSPRAYYCWCQSRVPNLGLLIPESMCFYFRLPASDGHAPGCTSRVLRLQMWMTKHRVRSICFSFLIVGHSLI